MRNKIDVKTPKAMALSFINDTFVNESLTMDERKKQCHELVTSYIGAKELDDWSMEYWIKVSEEILKIDL